MLLNMRPHHVRLQPHVQERPDTPLPFAVPHSLPGTLLGPGVIAPRSRAVERPYLPGPSTIPSVPRSPFSSTRTQWSLSVRLRHLAHLLVASFLFWPVLSRQSRSVLWLPLPATSYH